MSYKMEESFTQKKVAKGFCVTRDRSKRFINSVMREWD